MFERILHPFNFLSTLGLLAFSATNGLALVPVTHRDVAGARDVCVALQPLADGRQDSAPTLQHCLDSAPPGAMVSLPAGSYLLLSPITIRKTLALTTAGLSAATPSCHRIDPRCATLLPTMSQATPTGTPMPIDVQADGVTIDHIIFAGTRTRAPKTARALCLSSTARSLAGGLRLSGQKFRVTRSVFRDFACYSSFELGTGSGIIAHNMFLNNGTHTVNMMWSDGLTIHDGKGITVTDNIFLDNTDVQLIFGGCINCRVLNNRFRHSTTEAGGSFAELMIQAWPGGATSGDYDGALFSKNDIDCGKAHRCGFGIMIGALPWYQAPTRGGIVTDNSVRNAMLGINVDGLSGPMEIGTNRVVPASGSYHASCGERSTTEGLNIAPSSRRFVSSVRITQTASAQSYANCILNYPHFSK